MKAKKSNSYWTGFRAVIEGETFVIVAFINSKVMQIALPNGKFAIVDQHLADKITT